MAEKQNPYSFDTETLEGRRRLTQRDLDRYDPRRLMITREELDELGIEYDGDALEPKIYQRNLPRSVFACDGSVRFFCLSSQPDI